MFILNLLPFDIRARRLKRLAEKDDRDYLYTAYRQSRLRQAAAVSMFNAVADPELVEAAIYELKAEKLRCGYFFGRLRELGFSESPDADPPAAEPTDEPPADGQNDGQSAMDGQSDGQSDGQIAMGGQSDGQGDAGAGEDRLVRPDPPRAAAVWRL